jgi:hypothetical protein
VVGEAGADFVVGRVLRLAAGIADRGAVDAGDLPEQALGPQKQPSPKTACCRPPGNGATMRLPLTKCVSGTCIFSARPGSVLSAGSSVFIFFMKANMAEAPVGRTLE